MMSVLSILLLLTVNAATGIFLRYHIYIHESLTWTKAQEYCRSNYEDLSVIDSAWEKTNFQNQTSDLDYETSWIGLRKEINEREFTRWSNGLVLKFSMWADEEPENLDRRHCVAIKENVWENEDCTEDHPFFCYTWIPQMIVVQEMKTWEEALVHCRTHYTDLVSLTSATDFLLVNNRSQEILTPTFWTSLRFMDGSWFWANWKTKASVTSMPSCPARSFWCGAWNIRAGVWENGDCNKEMNFICYQF